MIARQLKKEYNKKIRSVLFATIKAFFVFPLLYARRRRYFNMGLVKDNIAFKRSHWYWLCDNSEHIDGDSNKPLDFISCWWGDENYRIRKGFDYNKASAVKKYFAAMRWVIFRNGAWNLKLLNGWDLRNNVAELVEVIKNEGDASPTTWRNQKYVGEQCVLLRFGQLLTYRYSYTKELPKLSLYRLLGYKYRNKMRGAGKERWIYKNRLFRNLL